MSALHRKKSIAFTVDCKGRPIAYRWCWLAGRWIRIGLENAKFLVATEQAHEVEYRK